MDLSMHFDNIDDMAVSASTGVPDPVPPGNYRLQTTGFDLTPTKAGTGKVLKATFEVIEGPCEGRKVFAQYNIVNPNAQAQMIGIGELKALAIACGVPWEMVRSETDLLLHKPFLATVDFEKQEINQSTGQPYPLRNRVKKYVPHGETVAAPAAAVALAPVSAVLAGSATAPVAAKAGNPWDKPPM